MIAKTHYLQFTLALALTWLTGCSSIHSGVQHMGDWAGDARAALPLLPAHTVHREQNYPVSSQAPIYVHGSDPVLVEALARELRLYFSSVALLHGAAAQSGDGFALRLHSAGDAGAIAVQAPPTTATAGSPIPQALSNVAQPASQRESKHNSQLEPQQVPTRYARELRISVTDRHSNITFDRMTIDLFSVYQSDSAAAQKKIQRAFNQAAALLAGQS